MGLMWIAAAVLWGAAEASVFFIVPDVLLTAAALRLGVRRALLLCLIAACAAALTGAILWLWAGHDPVAARQTMLHVPAVGPDLLARVHGEFDSAWPLHLLWGAMTGVPYKLYAVEAGSRHIPLLLFVPVSVGAAIAVCPHDIGSRRRRRAVAAPEAAHAGETGLGCRLVPGLSGLFHPARPDLIRALRP
jgi:hypothetical protein